MIGNILALPAVILLSVIFFATSHELATDWQIMHPRARLSLGGIVGLTGFCLATLLGSVALP